ncbi:MAG: hypothetical protein IKG61_03450 [Selenomonadaceae bacterium]|nr:hypothetical protein [Selenomonadaceae bacterium]
MKNITSTPAPFEFTVAESLTFLNDLPKLPTDARNEEANFISKLNCAVATLRTDFSVWFALENFPHEEWRDIIGYEGDYKVSNYGRLKSLKNNRIKIMRLTYTKDGYLEASISKNGAKKRTGIHNLVAGAFIYNPKNKPQVNHEDTNSLNNCLWNLNWVTNQENQQHAIKMGVKRIGCEFPGSKLNEEQVRYIRKHYIASHPEFGQAALSRKFNVSNKTIQDVIHDRSYKNVI